MGKTTKPLRIGIHPDQIAEQWVADLVTQGHEVTGLGNLMDYDLILGPNCCRFLPGMEFVLDSVIKGARKLRYGKEKP